MAARHRADPEHLLHFSEDPAIKRFVPHVPETNPGQPPLVWTIDEDHAPLFWFPRDCPRITFWSSGGLRVHAMEEAWVERMRSCQLFVYRFAPAHFRPSPDADGYWVSVTEQLPLGVEPAGDLFERHRQRGIELRIVPDLRPVRDGVLASDVRFSMCRMANVGPPCA
jgi:hypothetical protein